jgi:hypothetical protein
MSQTKAKEVEMFPSWQGTSSLLNVFPSPWDPWEETPHSEQALSGEDPYIKVGFHLLYASWNLPLQPIRHDRLQSMLCSHKISIPKVDVPLGTKNSAVSYVASVIQVDESEETMDLFHGDFCGILGRGNGRSGNSDTTHSEFSDDPIPCPPEHLPALVLVLERSKSTGGPSRQRQVDIQYLSTMNASELLFHVRRNVNQHPLLPAKVLDEIEEIVRDSILFGGPGNHKHRTTKGSRKPPQQQPQNNHSTSQPALRIFVAGDRMSVGKSSVCLGLLGTLITKFHYSPDELAYIKPATQNESPQLVQLYCDAMGIDCMAVGPIVYYRGFTRAYLAGETECSDELLAKVEVAVDRMAHGKRVVIVDGVGFPAVGSICGTDNATVARASGYPLLDSTPDKSNHDKNNDRRPRRCPMGVLLVGGSGVGSAVDAFHMNATYFEQAQVPVLGAIFNKLSLEGFYSLENCKAQITSYFDQNLHQQQLRRRPFGFVPLFSGLGGDEHQEGEMGKEHDDSIKKRIMLEYANQFFQLFGDHVDVTGILEAAQTVQREQLELYRSKPEGIAAQQDRRDPSPPSAKRLKLSPQPVVAVKANSAATASSASRARTRAEIEGHAIQLGAAPSA